MNNCQIVQIFLSAYKRSDDKNQLLCIPALMMAFYNNFQWLYIALNSAPHAKKLYCKTVRNIQPLTHS